MATFNSIFNSTKLQSLQEKAINAKGLRAKVLEKQIAKLQAEAIPQVIVPKTVLNITKKVQEAKPSKDIVFLGKTYKIGKNQQYKSIVQVAKKLNVDFSDLKKYRDDKNKTRTIIKGNESIEIDLKNKKPLLLREFGISRITNKQLIKETNTVKRQDKIFKIFENVPDSADLKCFVEAVIWVNFSEKWEVRTLNFEAILNKGDNLNELLYEKAKLKFTGIPKSSMMTEYDRIGRNIPIDNLSTIFGVYPLLALGGVKITRNNQGGQTMRIENMILRDDTPPSIKNMYSNVIEDSKWRHCIHDYMLEVYKKQFSIKTLQNLNTTDDIYNFCVQKNIKMIAYDINGNCIKANYPLLSNRSRLKNLFFIAHNNHLYPLKSQYLNKVNHIIDNVEMITDSNKKIIEILEQGRYVSNINLFGSQIVSFNDTNIKYICNDEYVKCKEILEKFGLVDKIYDGIRVAGLGRILKELYITKSDKSVFIGHNKFVKGGFNYFNDKLQGKITTIDFNKFYPSCLKDLNFLI
jgi:hypothetical protein